LCQECGGGEQEQIFFFMPGEVEYVAGRIAISASEFIDRFCHIIPVGSNTVYLLRGGTCPFLNAAGRTCDLEGNGSKPLSCLTYPAMIGCPGDARRVWIDDIDCPMAHRVSAEFTQKALGLLECLREQLPNWWLEFNLEHGWPPYDYEKLTAMKGRKVISVEDLRHCQSRPYTPGKPD